MGKYKESKVVGYVITEHTPERSHDPQLMTILSNRNELTYRIGNTQPVYPHILSIFN